MVLLHRRLPLTVLALCVCLCLLSAATASLAELSGAGLDRVNHHVEYHYLDDEHQGGGGGKEEAYLAPRGQEVILTRHDGTRFNCTLPRVEASASSGQTPNVPRPSVVSLLAPLKHNCLYRLEGWWTYEYCRGRWVQQFHQEGDERIAAFTLGLAPPEDPDEESARRRVETEEGPREVYSELHADGTICDITGKPRTVQLDFYCSPETRTGMLVSLKEPSTCNYLLSVATPLLCAHPEFKVEEKAEQAIICRELPPQAEDEDDSNDVELELDPPTWLQKNADLVG